MKRFSLVLLLSIALVVVSLGSISAQESSETKQHYIGKSVFAGNNKYSESNKIESDDIHFGWNLGQFIVSGFTDKVQSDGKTVFLKDVGDKVKLSFKLQQNINKLNDNEDLTISSDDNGSDEVMGVEKQDFKHGALIIKKTNYENKTDEPIVYTDYLKNKAKVNANKTVDLFEEGDYEVSLDYEIDEYRKILPDNYPNYKIHFKFSVRNGNCMIYPRDLATKSELENSAFAENGFYLDLAKSRYLSINVKKEVLVKDGSKLVSDTRFNSVAKEGDEYKDEGIYTIKVKNKYTDEKTTKVICVGNNKVLKAHVVTGLSIKDINDQVKHGASINDDGNINGVKVQDVETKNDSIPLYVYWIIGAAVVLLLVLFIVLLCKKKKKKPVKKTYYEDDEEIIEFEEDEE